MPGAGWDVFAETSAAISEKSQQHKAANIAVAVPVLGAVRILLMSRLL